MIKIVVDSKKKDLKELSRQKSYFKNSLYFALYETNENLFKTNSRDVNGNDIGFKP